MTSDDMSVAKRGTSNGLNSYEFSYMKGTDTMTLFPKPLTETEYIAKVRRNVSRTNRYGFWMSLVSLSALLFILWQFGQVLRQFFDSNTPFPIGHTVNPTAWVVCGFIFGTLIGVGFGAILQAYRDGVLLPFTGMRTERLLLRYHDELQGVATCDTTEDPLDGLFSESPTDCEPVPAGACHSERNELRKHLKHAASRSTLSAKS